MSACHAPKLYRGELRVAGTARPARPAMVWGEDFSLVLRMRRIRIARNRIQVLN